MYLVKDKLQVEHGQDVAMLLDVLLLCFGFLINCQSNWLIKKTRRCLPLPWLSSQEERFKDNNHATTK